MLNDWRTDRGPPWDLSIGTGLLSTGVTLCSLLTTRSEYRIAVDHEAQLVRTSLERIKDRPEGASDPVLRDLLAGLGHSFEDAGFDRSLGRGLEVLRQIDSLSEAEASSARAVGWPSAPIAVVLDGQGVMLRLHARLVRGEGVGPAGPLTHEPGLASAFVPFDDDWWSGFDDALAAVEEALGKRIDTRWHVEWCVDMRPLWDALGNDAARIKAWPGLRGRSASGAFGWLAHALLAAASPSRRAVLVYLPRTESVAVNAVLLRDGTLAPVDDVGMSAKHRALQESRSPGTDLVLACSDKQPAFFRTDDPGLLRYPSLRALIGRLVDDFGPRRFGPCLASPDPPAAATLHARPRLKRRIADWIEAQRAGYVLVTAPAEWGLTCFAREWVDSIDLARPLAVAWDIGRCSSWDVLLDLQHRTRVALGLPFDPPQPSGFDFDFNGNRESQKQHLDEFLRAMSDGERKHILLVDAAQRLVPVDTGRCHPALPVDLPDGVFVILLVRQGVDFAWPDGARPRPGSLLAIDAALEFGNESDELVKALYVELADRWQGEDAQAAAAVRASRPALVVAAKGDVAMVDELARQPAMARLDWIRNPPEGLLRARARALVDAWRIAPNDPPELFATTCAVLALVRGGRLDAEGVTSLLFGPGQAPRLADFAPGSGEAVDLPTRRLGRGGDFARALRQAWPHRGRLGRGLAAGVTTSADRVARGAGGVAAVPDESLTAAIADVAAWPEQWSAALAPIHALLAGACEHVLRERTDAAEPIRTYAATWCDWHWASALGMLDPADLPARSRLLLERLLDARLLGQRTATSEPDQPALRAWFETVAVLKATLSALRDKTDRVGWLVQIDPLIEILDAASAAIAQWQAALGAGQIDAAVLLQSLLGAYPAAVTLSDSWREAVRAAGQRTLRVAALPAIDHALTQASVAPSGRWMTGRPGGGDQIALWAIDASGALDQPPVATWDVPSEAVAGQPVCLEFARTVMVAMLLRGPAPGRQIHVLRCVDGRALAAVDLATPASQRSMVSLTAASALVDGVSQLSLCVSDAQGAAWIATLDILDEGVALEWEPLTPSSEFGRPTACALQWHEGSGRWRAWQATPGRHSHRVRRWDWHAAGGGLPELQRNGAELPRPIVALAPLDDGRVVAMTEDGGGWHVDADGRPSPVIFGEGQVPQVPVVAAPCAGSGLLVALVDGRVVRARGEGPVTALAPAAGAAPRSLSSDADGNRIALGLAASDGPGFTRMIPAVARRAPGSAPAGLAEGARDAIALATADGAVGLATLPGQDAVVRTIDTRRCTVDGRAPTHPIEVTALCWHNELPALLMGDKFGRVLRWRVQADDEADVVGSLEPCRIDAIAPAPRGAAWIGARQGLAPGGLHRWDHPGRDGMHRLKAGSCSDIRALAALGSGVLVGDGTGTVGFWAGAGWEPIASEPASVLAVATLGDPAEAGGAWAAAVFDGGACRVWRREGGASWRLVAASCLPFTGAVRIGLRVEPGRQTPALWALGARAFVEGVVAPPEVRWRVQPLPSGRWFTAHANAIAPEHPPILLEIVQGGPGGTLRPERAWSDDA